MGHSSTILLRNENLPMLVLQRGLNSFKSRPLSFVLARVKHYSILAYEILLAKQKQYNKPIFYAPEPKCLNLAYAKTFNTK